MEDTFFYKDTCSSTVFVYNYSLLLTGSTPNAIPTDEEMVNYDCPIPKELEDGNNVLWLAIISVVVIIGGNCILKSEFYEKCKQKFLHLKED